MIRDRMLAEYMMIVIWVLLNPLINTTFVPNVLYECTTWLCDVGTANIARVRRTHTTVIIMDGTVSLP
jgi:hypothetical protein